uniref:BZIP domain-containing protein n=1 Tax=Corethron hystrix TaxID=216773 RepID=A0A7S1FZ26_9STRA|eukprot:CAMPEP_0113314206 /NCGR_PEP_ID=MMETSP0010_2-20120614/10353_1 /TAXON_ID=216773 ORGANISM="Corethron hystrix, Strain 308" /NCGR_SAMPLE_ID=MMETSP0010_2 /ASSEMBLY_ACC=CAM_ASM_000155 /LENGTH=316 /DNA_ID=CAMNT_0000170433 /DNA_START=114 /DNA_END=1064 /DNA_ORIENTATION=- /assembly_acc=CAM_ASM_000155
MSQPKEDQSKSYVSRTVDEQSRSIHTTSTSTLASDTSEPSPESLQSSLNPKRQREDHLYDDRLAVHDSDSNAVSSSSSLAEENQSKRMKRILSNREHARASYLRKKKMIEDLKGTLSKLEEENKRLREENKLLKANELNSIQYANTSLITMPHLGMPTPQDISKSSYMCLPTHPSMLQMSLPGSSVPILEQKECLLGSSVAMQQSSGLNQPTYFSAPNVASRIPVSSPSVFAAEIAAANDYQRLIGNSIRNGVGYLEHQALPSRQQFMQQYAFSLLDSTSSVPRQTHQVKQIPKDEAVRLSQLESDQDTIRRVSDN